MKAIGILYLRAVRPKDGSFVHKSNMVRKRPVGGLVSLSASQAEQPDATSLVLPG